jgi:hypothetical protein
MRDTISVAGKIVEVDICPVCPGRMALYPRETFQKHMERHDIGIHTRSYKWTQPGWVLSQARRAKKAQAALAAKRSEG